MKMSSEVEVFLLLIFGLLGNVLGYRNDLSCSAPRSPTNGLSFIFQNGELVHFRCHPGFIMKGKRVSYCINNRWTAPPPECLPVRRDHPYYKEQQYRDPAYTHDDSNYYSHRARPESTIYRPDYKAKSNIDNSLFDWENTTRKKGVYGDGPRRLPLINGIWPNQSIQIMALGPKSTPGPMELVHEEVNIAELRQRQYEEVARQRATNFHSDLPPKKRRGHKKRKRNRKISHSDDINGTAAAYNINSPRETVISLGNTIDGDALSIAVARNNSKVNNRHKYRHHDVDKKWKRKKPHKKNRNWYYGQQENVIARSSRVDTSGLDPYSIYYRRQKPMYNNVAEFKRKPVLEIDRNLRRLNISEFDSSCVESFYGRDLPMIAPQIPHAYVYRYETKKNKEYPFNTYMQVKYQCLSGYRFSDAHVKVLNCREAAWVGQIPQCVDVN